MRFEQGQFAPGGDRRDLVAVLLETAVRDLVISVGNTLIKRLINLGTMCPKRVSGDDSGQQLATVPDRSRHR